VILLDKISRTYDIGAKPVEALQELDLEIPGGEYVSVMGASGSGKSTLLNILGCLDRPTSGKYLLNGEEVSNLTEEQLSGIRRYRIGFVFQTFHLIPRLTASANVELPMTFAGIERAERRERSALALGSVGLSERTDHRPDQLSGGECQRVAIARAVVMNPSILLADEPTGNLDSVAGGEIVRLLEKMNEEGLTLIVVTHNPEIGERSRLHVRLADGRRVK